MLRDFVLHLVFQFQIASVSGNDGGNYTCSPQNILSDAVMVNIMEVKHTFEKNVSRDGPILNLYLCVFD